MRRYAALAKGMSPAGWVVAGLVVGSVGAPLVIKGLEESKKGLRGLAVSMVSVTLSAGRHLENYAKRQGDWWNSVVEEARTRHEHKKAAGIRAMEESPLVKSKVQVEEHGHTFTFKERESKCPADYN